MTLLHALRIAARSLGVEVHRYNPLHSTDARLLAMLNHHRIDVVIDVGANTGGYAQQLRASGFAGSIVSFEPLADAHIRLARNASGDAHWHVMPRMALGDEHGSIEINVAGNSTSSSVLPMLPLHEAAAPSSRYVGKESVPVRTLDSLDHPLLVDPAKRRFLKIDTQGYEMQVLRGATHSLEVCRGVQLEMSLVELYEGQQLFSDTLDWLSSKGFELWFALPGFTAVDSGRMLQMDGIFFRRG